MADSKQTSTGVNIVSKMDEDSHNEGPPPPRENMIATAIRFLQNPKVRETPFPQRRTFLAKKGLTEKEIDIAIERSGTAGDATAVVPAVQPAQNVLPVVQAPVAVASPWSRWRDYTATVIVIGGVSYGLYYLIKKYVMPMWIGPSEEQKRTAALQSSIKELENSLQTVVRNLQELQKSMKEQQETLRQVVINSSSSRGPMELDKMQQHQYVSEIKGEIQSLKGLLLSRKQFPPTPKTTPVIPAWQLGGSTKSTTTGPSTVSEVKSGAEGTSDIQAQTSSPIVNGDVSTETKDSSTNVVDEGASLFTMDSSPESASNGSSSDEMQIPAEAANLEMKSKVVEVTENGSHETSETDGVRTSDAPVLEKDS